MMSKEVSIPVFIFLNSSMISPTTIASVIKIYGDTYSQKHKWMCENRKTKLGYFYESQTWKNGNLEFSSRS